MKSREIKFRAFEPDTWCFDYWTVKVGEEIWIHSCHENPQSFTGLKDKNGKEIYGGDIVYAYMAEENGADVIIDGEFPVVWNDGSYWIGDIPLMSYIETDLQVIGNIFEK